MWIDWLIVYFSQNLSYFTMRYTCKQWKWRKKGWPTQSRYLVCADLHGKDDSLLQGCPILYTGCSLNIVFFQTFWNIFRTLVSLCLPWVSVCVHWTSRLDRHDGRSNTSAAAELAEFRKITTFSEKNTIFNEHPVTGGKSQMPKLANCAGLKCIAPV